MDYTIQEFIIALIVGFAAFTLIKKFRPKKGKACGKNCDGCPVPSDQTEVDD
ncbi:MAG: FeoB-associated Cys-rich membrane protein [Cytophagales bacterium]|nr:FeoB-associated Cys-rich membrane protein [Cytophagales bacterium]